MTIGLLLARKALAYFGIKSGTVGQEGHTGLEGRTGAVTVKRGLKGRMQNKGVPYLV